MNFFQTQAEANSQTKKLLFLYGILVITISLLVGFTLVSGGYIYASKDYYQDQPLIINYDIAYFISLITFFILIISTFIKVRMISQDGGVKIATELGGFQVSPFTGDKDEKKLVNIVSEMSIASGVPLPAIFILKEEDSINAFAAGYDFHDSAIAVTQGALDKLSRDELQSVVAHEFGHIKSGDMRLNMKMLGLIFGFNFLSMMGRQLMNSRSRGKNSGNLAVAGIVIYILGGIGILFGMILQASISRQREFNADASSVQFTRQNEGLINALKKIFNIGSKNKLTHPRASEMSHFMLSHTGSFFLNIFATHPPLLDRISNLKGKGKLSLEEKEEISKVETYSNTMSKTSSFVSPRPELNLPNYQHQSYQIFVDLSDETTKLKQVALLKETNFEQQKLHQSPLSIVLTTAQAMKMESVDNKENFLKLLKNLVEVDNKVTLQEFLYYTLFREILRPSKRKAMKSYKIDSILNELKIIDELFANQNPPVSLVAGALEKIKDLHPLDKEKFLTRFEKVSNQEALTLLKVCLSVPI